MLEKIVGIEFDLADNLQAQLPLSKSGLVGTRSSVKHSDADCISGSSSSSALVSQIVKDEAFTDPVLMATVTNYNDAVNETDRLVVNLEDIKPIQQKPLSVAVDFRTRDELKSILSREADDHVRNLNLDRLNSIAEYSSFCWLLAVPNVNLGLGMTNRELQIALQIRLGHMEGFAASECPGGSVHEVERSGLEILKCKRKFQHKRHDHLVEVFTKQCRAAGLFPVREKLGNLADGSRKRPGDVTVDTFDRGGKTAFDFRVTSNKQAMFTGSLQEVGRVALYGDQIKMRNWDSVRGDSNIQFIPMACDVYGLWTMRARNVFWEVAKRRREFTGLDPDTEFRYAMQVMSMALQRENARIFEQHVPRRVIPVEDADTDEDEPPIILDEDAITTLWNSL
jgi:hypothetical protein